MLIFEFTIFDNKEILLWFYLFFLLVTEAQNQGRLYHCASPLQCNYLRLGGDRYHTCLFEFLLYDIMPKVKSCGHVMMVSYKGLDGGSHKLLIVKIFAHNRYSLKSHFYKIRIFDYFFT